jgi:hypothetical protein
VNELQSIDALLKVDVLVRELCLYGELVRQCREKTGVGGRPCLQQSQTAPLNIVCFAAQEGRQCCSMQTCIDGDVSMSRNVALPPCLIGGSLGRIIMITATPEQTYVIFLPKAWNLSMMALSVNGNG